MKSFLLNLPFIFLLTSICFAQWVPTDTSFHFVNCLASRGSYIYTGIGSHIYVSTDGGGEWNSIDSDSIHHIISAITFSAENIIVGTMFSRIWGEIYISDNNGNSWNEVLNSCSIHSLFSKDNNVFVGSYSALYSSDGGTTWDTVNAGLPASTIEAFAASDTKIFAGSQNDGVYLTTDNGISWVAVNNGLSSLHIRALAVAEPFLFAGTSDGIYRASDDGTNWVSVNSGIPEDDFEGANDFTVVGTNIFVSLEFLNSQYFYAKVYLSTNFGESWDDVSAGLPEEMEFISALTSNGTYLFAGRGELYPLPSVGVWRRPLSEMITDVDGNINQLPDHYNLSQNYPNPYNPGTKIKYSIPQSSQVQIKVFNALGNEIETLVNEEKPSGTYELNWNDANLPSGVYFYQLKAGEFMSTKKKILLK